MKKTIRTIISILAVGAMLLSFAACDDKKDESNALMQGIFEKLQADEAYKEMKVSMPGTTIEEKLDGNSIVFSGKSEGDYSINGDYVFNLDGDYIIYTTQDKEDYNGYTFFNYIKRAVADYYGMSSMLMTGYIAGLDVQNDYMTVDMENGVYKLYAKEWDMKGLDTMYVDEKAMAGQKEVFDMSHNLLVNYGKVYVKAYGTADDFAMVVAEYGKNTELTYKSITAAVQELMPENYSILKKYYTELKEVSDADGYTISFGLDKNVAETHDLTTDEGYSYVTVTFTASK